MLPLWLVPRWGVRADHLCGPWDPPCRCPGPCPGGGPAPTTSTAYGAPGVAVRARVRAGGHAEDRCGPRGSGANPGPCPGGGPVLTTSVAHGTPGIAVRARVRAGGLCRPFPHRGVGGSGVPSAGPEAEGKSRWPSLSPTRGGTRAYPASGMGRRVGAVGRPYPPPGGGLGRIRRQAWGGGSVPLAVPIPHRGGTRGFPVLGMGRSVGAAGHPYPPTGGGLGCTRRRAWGGGMVPLAVPIPHPGGTRVYPAPVVGGRDGAAGRPYPPSGGRIGCIRRRAWGGGMVPLAVPIPHPGGGGDLGCIRR